MGLKLICFDCLYNSFCFVKYFAQEVAVQAIVDMNGNTLNGQRLRVYCAKVSCLAIWLALVGVSWLAGWYVGEDGCLFGRWM